MPTRLAIKKPTQKNPKKTAKKTHQNWVFLKSKITNPLFYFFYIWEGFSTNFYV